VNIYRLRRSRVVALFLFTLFSAAICRAESSSTPIAVAAANGTSASSRGINFSLSNALQHSSVTGWSDVSTPDLSYRLSSHFFADANFPWCFSVQNFVKTKVNGVVTYPLKQAHNVIGDATASGHFEATPGDFHYVASATVGFPTGDSKFGLSANSTTYNINNHIEYSLGPFNPDIEIGEGNSSSLLHHAAKKSYTAVGQIANFQAGASIDLPRKLSLDLEAYEALPLGNQNIYGTMTKTGKNGKPKTKQVLEGQGVAEDNGFNAELDIPLARHFTLGGSYERGLIQGTDDVGIALTWTLRAPSKHASAAR